MNWDLIPYPKIGWISGCSHPNVQDSVQVLTPGMARMHLRHKEVADLLYATPLGLTDWDIKLLLSTATEFETGRPGCEGWIFFKMFLSGLSGTMFGNLATWLWEALMTWVCKTVCSRWWNFWAHQVESTLQLSKELTY